MRFTKSREITVVILTASKTFTSSPIPMFYEPTWSILGMMINTTKLYSSFLV